jgi:hypothetical protein
MENACRFYGHLQYFTAIRYVSWQFGNVVVIWYIFHRFGILCHEKSGIPGPDLALTRIWIPQNFRNPEFTKTDAIWICPNKFMYLKLKLKSKFF